jgi:hypothetical protein
LAPRRGFPLQNGLAIYIQPTSASMLGSLRHAVIPRVALVATLLTAFVLALILAASPELHAKVHDHGGEQEHECLATIIASGGCDDSYSPLPLIVPVLPPAMEAPAACVDHASSFYLSCRCLEHAPPRFS